MTGFFEGSSKSRPRSPVFPTMSNELTEIVEQVFRSDTTPQVWSDIVPKMRADKKRSIGPLRPWAWWTEVTRGCNLRCGFCATRLFERGQFSYMTMETWKQMIEIVAIVCPLVRLEIGNAGEPTLNEKLPEFFRYARERCPTIQLMIFTNGTTLLDGRTSYEQLFEAGLNCVFVDMYAPLEKHAALAEKSGYRWFTQENKPEGAPNVFEYQNDPDFHCIMLCPNPGDWPKRKVSRGAFSTFFNHLDWKAAEKYGLKPIVEPPKRNCDLPSKYPVSYWDGAYTFCCFDFMREVAGTLGNVSDGVDGFFRYWFGEYMQASRRLLYEKNRAAHSMCSKCAFTSIRGDIQRWPVQLLDHWWDGTEWHDLEIRR